MDHRAPLHALGRLLLIGGILVAAGGLMLMLVARWTGLDRLPGDIVIRREGWSLFVPITTCIVISLVLTLLVNLFLRR